MIELITTNDDKYPLLLDLRNRILRLPLGLDINDDDLSDEPDCLHLAYLTVNGLVVGCLKIKPLGNCIYQVLQMAVHEKYQARGIGTALLKHAESVIKEQEGTTIVVEARYYAIPFYQKYGFRKDGKMFEKINIPHQRMTKIV